MLASCRELGAAIGVVLVQKIDRLARNLTDHLALKAVLVDRFAARVIEPDTYALAADALLAERVDSGASSPPARVRGRTSM
jgi:hypothetical protein